MKVAVMWTISDFSGLDMLGGVKTKGYKPCPICLDEVDAIHLIGRMAYQEHHRWLPKNHEWRKAGHKFNGQVETMDMPPSLSGYEILDEIISHDYPTLSVHPMFKDRGTTEKNIFDNIIGIVLALEGKTKDDQKACEGLMKQGVHKHLWDKFKESSSKRQKVSQASYTVSSEHKVEILEMIKDVQYPHGYAGSLKNKINLYDKMFNDLKTHDCHVMLQRILPVVIQLYFPYGVVSCLIDRS
ncbi:unnamed protein product [Rhodiola kirilowii]